MAKAITEMPAKCKCGWFGSVFECDCDADLPDVEDDGRLRCPECSKVIVVKTVKHPYSTRDGTVKSNNPVYDG